MITTPQSRINNYTEHGWWGTDTLHSLLAEAATEFPNRLAVADQPNRLEFDGHAAKRLSYRELEIASNKLACQILNQGIEQDDIVMVQLPNIVELVVCYYAMSKIGAIVSPLPIQYGPHEILDIQAKLGAKHIVCCQRWGKQEIAANVKIPNVTTLVFNEDNGLFIETGSEDQSTQILTDHQSKCVQAINNANSIVTICWTSGTTGTPKGVPRSHNMWLSTTQSIIDACDYREGDQLLNPFPLINMAAIGGFLFPAVKQVCSLFLHHPLDPTVYLQQLQDEQITFTIAPPALLNQLAKSPQMWANFDFSSLRCVGSGSAPLAPWMIDVFEQQYGKEVVNFYGSNEGICLLSNKEFAPNAEQRATMFPRLGLEELQQSNRGSVYKFAKTRLADPESGQSIDQPHCAGELLIDGPTIFDGYFMQEDQAEIFSSDGYFRTGDLVEICGQPPLSYRIVGRCKDIINRGGVKISPAELDQLLEGHPRTLEAAVCAYPDERLGEKVCACIVPSDPNVDPGLDEIIEYLNELGVAKYKLPERLEVLGSLPRNPMNKVLRHELAELVARRITEQSQLN